MPRKTVEDAQCTRRKIIKGALDVFGKKGYSLSTLSDIAHHIGMTRGAVYWHFKNKQDLAIELIKTMVAREKAFLRERAPTRRTLKDLSADLMARIDMIEEDEELRKFATFMSLQVEWATEKQINFPFHEKSHRDLPFHSIFEILSIARDLGEIRPDVDIAQTYDILLGIYIGMVRNSLSGLSTTPLRAGLKQAVSAIADSIRAPRP